MISENPSWVPLNATEIEDLVEKFTKEGVSPAMIGMILRDQYAVPNVKLATGKTVTEIQAARGVKADLPADLSQLMVRAINLNTHLKANPKEIFRKAEARLKERGFRILDALSLEPYEDSHKMIVVERA